MNDDQRLLANAAFDGELTAEEQARAEADPEVVAELERLAALRAGLRAVEPLAPARREAVLAVALDAFGTDDALSRASRTVAPPPASLAARRRARWLLPAAAAALVGVAAVGAIVGNGGGDDESSDPADAILEAPAGADLTVTEQTHSLDDATASVTAADLDATFGTMLTQDSLAAPPLTLVRTPDELAAYAATAPELETGEPTADAPTTTAAPRTADAAPADTTGAAATEAADGTVVARTSSPSAAGPTCPVDGDYLGTVLYGSDPTSAVVVDVVRRGDVVIALAVAGCVEVAVVPGR